MKRSRFRLSLVFSCLLALLVGCSQQQKPVLPETGIIPLKVWCVLADYEQPGIPYNYGCRLSLDQITDRIEQLQRNTFIYGSNITFQWPPAEGPAIEIIRDPCLGLGRGFEVVCFHENCVSQHWCSDHLNIYFHGDVHVGGQETCAGSLDPDDVQGIWPERPWILINDGGFEQEYNFRPGFEPENFITYNITEHEMTHSLLRRKGVPPYDDSEHVPDGTNNILQAEGVGPGEPYPLVVPGAWNQPATEQGEIWHRVYYGLWPYP